MIFYFSGTGNSEWVALELAKATNDTVMNIATIDATSKYSFSEGDKVGIVFPIYAWRAPEIVSNFIKRIDLNGAYTYGVCTVGNEAGRAMEHINKTFPLDASFSIQMPNTYVPMFDTDGEEIERNKIQQAIPKIVEIADKINNKVKIFDIAYGPIPRIYTYVVSPVWNKLMRGTKKFYVTDKCINCGLCAKKCPAKVITIIDDKPVWTKSTCYQCMKCLHKCPTIAIQYGKGTLTKGRYYMKDDYLK